jgi:ABC-type polysaccharide/polyol phosphate export permease
VHPFSAGDPHGIVLFFLLLATLVSSVVVGALAALGTSDRSWTVPLGIVAAYAVSAAVVGGLAAAWLAGGYGDGLPAAMAVVALLSFAVGIVVAALARLLGPIGVALGALVVVFLGLVSSGGPLGTAFLPDAYRAIAPWLPVAPAADALRGALFFGSAGLATPLFVIIGWAILGVAVLAARDLVAPATRPTELATA